MAKRGRKRGSIDRISILPDELLGIILSHLKLKEAAATSILSRRWKTMWILTSRLDFTVNDQLVKFARGEDGESRRMKYVRFVNHVIALCNNSTYKDFKVYFNLTEKYQEFIDEWVRYALEKKVQTLELDLRSYFYYLSYHDNYVFPYEENCPSNFKQLQKISLSCVDVSDEALDFLLHNCPLLQHVSVFNSQALSTVRIVGPFPSLQSLEVSWCSELELVEIRDVMNLVYFKCGGYGIGVQYLLHNVPALVSVSVEGDLVDDSLQKFSNILPQLEILNIHLLRTRRNHLHGLMFSSVVEMKNLKQLVLKYRSLLYDIPVTNLLSRAPCLEKFVLEVACRSGRRGERKMEMIRKLYPQLKEVHFVGNY